MFTVFAIDGIPEYIYFCKSESYEQVLINRNIDKESVGSQEISLETLIRLKDNEYKVFTLVLK